jgi:hypothetical protein
MIETPFLALLLTTGAFATLAAVFLLSKDPSRRRRAWQLLRLLLRR